MGVDPNDQPVNAVPEDQVRVETVTDRHGQVVQYNVRVWYPFEGWNTVHSTHVELQHALNEAERIRRHLGDSNGANKPRT